MARPPSGPTVEELKAFIAERLGPHVEAGAERRARAGRANGRAPAGTGEQPGYIALRMSEVERKPIRWLWPDKLAYGKLSLLVGDGDLGKSWAMLDVAARLSTGTPLPGQEERPEPSTSVLLMGEDDAADTIGPRLDAQRADSGRVYLLQGVRRGATTAVVRLQRDLATVERLLEDVKAALLVIDPLASYLAGTDGINEIEVRQVLLPLAEMAQRKEVAVVAIMHRNKGEHRNPINAIGGSVAFGNTARCVLGVAADPECKGRRCLVPIKGNILKNEEGIGYRITDGELWWDNEPVGLTRETIFAGANGHTPPTPSEETPSGEAFHFAVRMLTEAGGRMETGELKARAREAGVSWRTMDRIKPQVARAEWGSENGKTRGYWVLRPQHGPSEDE